MKLGVSLSLYSIVTLVCVSLFFNFEVMKDYAKGGCSDSDLHVVTDNGNGDSTKLHALVSDYSLTEYTGNETQYVASHMEQYVLDNAKDLGYESERDPPGCNIWKPGTEAFQAYRKELRTYNELITAFPPFGRDIRDAMRESVRNGNDEHHICDQLELHPDGLTGIFNESRGLSFAEHQGFVEPLLPPLRDPEFCFNGGKIMSMDYLIHDFASMCRTLKSNSRIIMIDMGADPTFHNDDLNPGTYLTLHYAKFGFHFDHIYAFEVTDRKPSAVYDRLPKELMSSYHWINLGIDSSTESKFNPFSSIVKKFTEDDLVIVKLDVDTPDLEYAIAMQLLEEPELLSLVDHFYFEHHVHLGELARSWGTMNGTIKGSLDIFNEMRKKGVATHYWP